MPTTPFADSRLAQFIDKRIGELHHKTQAEIAREAGFPNANFITMLKTGTSKLALDRVPAFARALDCDPAMLMRLAVEQAYGPEMLRILQDLLGEPLTASERDWLAVIRKALGSGEPTVNVVLQVKMLQPSRS